LYFCESIILHHDTVALDAEADAAVVVVVVVRLASVNNVADVGCCRLCCCCCCFVMAKNNCQNKSIHRLFPFVYLKRPATIIVVKSPTGFDSMTMSSKQQHQPTNRKSIDDDHNIDITGH